MDFFSERNVMFTAFLGLLLVVVAMVAGLLSLRRLRATAKEQKSTVFASTAFNSQVGGKSVINYSYTDDPWRLMAYDIYQFFRLAWALPYILFPITPTDSGPLSELYPSFANLFCIAVHAVLCLLQVLFLLSLPFMVILPVWTSLLLVGGFLLLNHVFCLLLNGKGIEYHSDPALAAVLPEHAHEQWIFLNGVAVGDHWMQSNLDRLAITFKRPLLGVHNTTSGILFDVIECMIQRNLGYATTDVRVCYRIVKEKLYDPQYSKVVFILHSQGGIEGGLVLDWLLQELPQDLLAKLEVYTFGCAANHFNNPHRHIRSQQKDFGFAKATNGSYSRPNGATNGVPLNGMANETVPNGTANGSSPHPRRGSQQAVDRRPPSIITETSSSCPSEISDRAIGHIEHYAHTFDFVALWGVLHFTSTARLSQTLPRFIGRVFARSSVRGGHQFCQHYLDGMFPLERDQETGKFTGCAESGNEFMESNILVGREGEESANVLEAYQDSWLASLEGLGGGAQRELDVKIHGGSPILSRKGTMKSVKVKDLSRLWQYRNGRSPDETPPLLHRDYDGVIRGATM